MIAIEGAQLVRLNGRLQAERADLYATVLSDACADAAVASHRRICHFLAQVAEETGGFTSLVESTAYRDAARLDALFNNVHGVAHARRLIAAGPEAIGNTIYAGKLGNGDAASGDGYRYRGRGFLQITGRANYRALGAMIGMPLEQQPELLGDPTSAAQAASRFWATRRINVPADADDVGTVTLLVNGRARLHLAERRAWRDAARRIWVY